MLYKINRYPLRQHNHVEFYANGIVFYQALFKLIENTKNYIHIQIYIINNDDTGYKIAELLQKASARGVKIFLVIDGYGSGFLPNEFINYLKSFCNVVKIFSPLLKKYNLHIGLRLHHKIIISDGNHALIGGINIANKYSGINYANQWLDFGLSIKGDAVVDLNKICNAIINRNPLKKSIKLPAFSHQINNGNTRVRIIQNDRYRNKLGITRSYRNNIRKSTSEILIVSSYFLPANSFRRLLKNAAKRNVNITLILGETSDVKLVLFATRYFYGSLLKLGIKIYEWKETVLHGKMAIFDNCVTTIGSYNLNKLSDFGSIECNAEVVDEPFAANTYQTIQQQIIPKCTLIDPNTYQKKLTVLNKFKYWICYHILAILLNYLFFLQRKTAGKILNSNLTNEY